MSAVTARFLFVCGALLALASTALGDGIYQRTKDGKTMVWNSDPKPGDVAAWSGDRDRDGYANGFGTVTWYKERQQAVTGASKSTVYARYFGNMVQGKLDGEVNAHSKGKTAHAIFVDGRRNSHWVAGPAPSRRVAGQRIESAKQERAAEPEAPAAGPPPHLAAARKDEDRARRKADTEPPPPAAGPSVRPRYRTSPSDQRTGPTVDVNRPPDRVVPKPATNKKPKAEDDSLRLLVGPPSSLRKGPIDAGPSVSAKTEAASSPGANVRLTREEVIDLADAEARTRGYDLAEYQRAEPQYNAADDTWLVLYDQKPDANGMSETGKPFGVAVHDKTKNVSIMPGR